MSMPAAARRIVILHTGGMVLGSGHLCGALPNRRAFHPFSCAIIEHPAHGPVLFDTGLGSRTSVLLARRPLQLAARLARVVFADQYQLAEQLRAMGYEPTAIAHVVMSHLHLDHTGGMRDLPAATFHVTRTEWDHACAQHGLQALLRGYLLEDFRSIAPSFVEFDEEHAVWPFAGGCDLFGDGSVVLVPTPGHTPGHQSALVRLESGRQVMLAGDAALVRQNFTIPADQGMMGRGLRWDHAETWRTVLKLRAFWKNRPEVEIVPCHDGRLGRRLKRGPVILE